MDRSNRPPAGADAGDFSAAVAAISTAFGDPTRRDIYLFVAEHAEGVTAAATSETFALHPNVARHHLQKLVDGGYVVVDTERHEGTVGRPSKRYRAADPRSNAPLNIQLPLRQEDVLITLLGRALAMLPREHAERMAEEVGVEYGRAMAASAGATGGDAQHSFRSALHAVAEALTQHGFAAHAEKRGGKLRIVSETCPFGDAVIEHPVICAVDRGMVRGMLETLWGASKADTDASLPMGADRCITNVTTV